MVSRLSVHTLRTIRTTVILAVIDSLITVGSTESIVTNTLVARVEWIAFSVVTWIGEAWVLVASVAIRSWKRNNFEIHC